MTPNYPNVTVQLTGEDDSAPAIVSRCRRAAQSAGIPEAERDAFMRVALSGDYDNVIATALKWFKCS